MRRLTDSERAFLEMLAKNGGEHLAFTQTVETSITKELESLGLIEYTNNGSWGWHEGFKLTSRGYDAIGILKKPKGLFGWLSN